jgi:hypothetical protein
VHGDTVAEGEVAHLPVNNKSDARRGRRLAGGKYKGKKQKADNGSGHGEIVTDFEK